MQVQNLEVALSASALTSNLLMKVFKLRKEYLVMKEQGIGRSALIVILNT